MDFRRKLIRLALPISFQTLMLAMVAACDAFMLGRLDQDAMAAVSLATQVQFVQNMLLSCIAGTLSILGAQYWGRGDADSIGRLFRISLRTVLGVSVVFASACIFFPDVRMRLFARSDSPLVGIGARYLRIAGVSYLFTGVSQCYLASMKVTDHVNRATAISIGTVLVNIVLNAIFIFGLCGVPRMGVEGAAIATVVARVLEFGAAAASSHQRGYVRAGWRRLFERYPLLSKDFRKCALPLLGGAFFWGIGFSSYTAAMGHIGDDAAAANAVAAVIRDLLCCLCDGTAYGGGIVVGNELGAGNLARGKRYGGKLAKISVVTGFVAMAMVLLSILPVTRFLPIDLTDEARELLGQMMVVLSIYMVGRCVNTIVINGIFAAGGDTLFDFYSLAVCMWGLAVPLAFLGVFVFHWHPVLVYACTCVDEVGKLPWVAAHYRRYLWVKDLTRPSEARASEACA
jgi:putative MATE family efflux protein